MARITVTEAIDKIAPYSVFDLCRLVTRRVEQRRNGAAAFVECNNKEIVAAIREVEAGAVHPDNIEDLD